MARQLYCRWAKCGQRYESIAGRYAPICPGCGRVARWSTTPGRTVQEWKLGDPLRPFELNANDARFLKSIRIQAEAEDRILEG